VHLLLDHLVAGGFDIHERVYKGGSWRAQRVRALTTADKVMVNPLQRPRHHGWSGTNMRFRRKVGNHVLDELA
jgi:hypothetical protein